MPALFVEDAASFLYILGIFIKGYVAVVFRFTSESSFYFIDLCAKNLGKLENSVLSKYFLKYPD